MEWGNKKQDEGKEEMQKVKRGHSQENQKVRLSHYLLQQKQWKRLGKQWTGSSERKWRRQLIGEEPAKVLSEKEGGGRRNNFAGGA